MDTTETTPDLGASERVGDADTRLRLLLSLQRALLGEVSPALRSVALGWHDRAVDIVCYFDGPISLVDEESMSTVDAQVLGDFPDFTITFRTVRVDAPAQMAPLQAWVYRRRE